MRSLWLLLLAALPGCAEGCSYESIASGAAAVSSISLPSLPGNTTCCAGHENADPAAGGLPWVRQYYTASSAPVVVQSWQNTNISGGGNPLHVTGTATTAGNVIIVWCFNNQGNGDCNGVTDNGSGGSNSYSLAVNCNGSTALSGGWTCSNNSALYYSTTNPSHSTTNVAIATTGGGAAAQYGVVIEISGLDQSALVNASVATLGPADTFMQMGQDTCPTDCSGELGNLTTSAASVVVAAMEYGNGGAQTLTIADGSTLAQNIAGDGVHGYFPSSSVTTHILNSAQSYFAKWTYTVGSRSNGIAAAFKGP